MTGLTQWLLRWSQVITVLIEVVAFGLVFGLAEDLSIARVAVLCCAAFSIQIAFGLAWGYGLTALQHRYLVECPDCGRRHAPKEHP